MASSLNPCCSLVSGSVFMISSDSFSVFSFLVCLLPLLAEF